MVEEIGTIARCFLSRPLTEEQEEVLIHLCTGAVDHWKARLRDDLTPEDCRGAFLTACAWTALSCLAPALEAGAPRAFTAGDLSVSLGSSGWAQLARQAEALMADYTRDGGFVFREVAG